MYAEAHARTMGLLGCRSVHDGGETSSGRLSKTQEGSAYHVGLAHLAPASLDADGRPRGRMRPRRERRKLEEGMVISGGGLFVGFDLGGFLPNAFHGRVVGGWTDWISRGRPALWGAEGDKVVVVVAAMAAGCWLPLATSCPATGWCRTVRRQKI
jgi:hypothetical protein